jgi:FixJ family two-component response regulator
MITVVDDDPSVRKALSRLIKAAGYDVAAYETAEQFLAAGPDADSDCLILDVHLPGVSGLDLQTQLGEANRKCPIVFITAFDDKKARSQALAQGAVDFLYKPLDSERLLEVIDEAIHKI